MTNLTYDDARQLLSVDHRTAAGSLVRLGYAYDKLGNRTSQKWQDGLVDQYGYDPLSQLVQAQYAPLGATPTRSATLAHTTKHAYDPVGNRLSVTDTAGLTPASYSESFNSRLRDEFLNVEAFGSKLEAKVLGRDHREKYNYRRPHSSLGDLTPAEFAKRCLAPLRPFDSVEAACAPQDTVNKPNHQHNLS